MAEPARPTDKGNESTVEECEPRPSNPHLGIRSTAGGQVVSMAYTASEQAGTAPESDDEPPSSPSPQYSLLRSPGSFPGRFQDGESAADTPREQNCPTRAAPGEMPAQKAQCYSRPLRCGQCQHAPSGCLTCSGVIRHTQSTHTPNAAVSRPLTDRKKTVRGRRLRGKLSAVAQAWQRRRRNHPTGNPIPTITKGQHSLWRQVAGGRTALVPSAPLQIPPPRRSRCAPPTAACLVPQRVA